MFLVTLVGLLQHYSKRYEQTAMKYYGKVWCGTKKNCLHFGRDLGFLRRVNEQKLILVVACPDRGEGNDLETLGLVFHHQCPSFINMHFVKLLQTWLIETEG